MTRAKQSISVEPLGDSSDSAPLVDVERIRADFPILARCVHGKPLAYLDNAATTQKPQAVIDALHQYYASENANIHRGVHFLSQVATDRYEQARERVRDFINASKEQEIVFVRGTTEAINLVAHSYVRPRLKPDEQIIVSVLEHHSNIVPWQILCQEVGAKLRVIRCTDEGILRLDDYEKLLREKTRFVAVGHISNALGTINPVRHIVELAHQHGVCVLIDGAQAAPHVRVDMQQLDCDFYAFSGHKVYGPTGIGVLYGKGELLEAMSPYQGGGDMIKSVTFEHTTYNDPPYKFEAGTPNIAGGIGLGAAIDYVQKIGLYNITAYENQLLAYATEGLNGVPGLRLIGTALCRAGVMSFVMEGAHPHDIGTILDQEGVAIRTGHHCAQPLMQRFGVPATARASFGFYNTIQDIDALVGGLLKVNEVFA